MYAWELGVSVFAGVAAVVEDLRHRQISNWIPIFALISGLSLQVLGRGVSGLWSAFGGALCGFAVFLVFYMLGGLGGGDIKLMAGFGALLGPERLWVAAWWTAVLGAVMALFALGWWRLRGERHQAIPYAPAIAVGVWIAIGARG
jgi:prepilin peptidase CpaA